MTMTREQFVSEAKRLRSAADAAEVDFLEFLYQGEQTRDLWEDTGLDFATFVERADLCKATRYMSYRAMREAHGIDTVRSVGIHGLIAAARLKEPRQQAEALEEIKLWETTNGTSISEQSAKPIVRDIKTRVAVVKGGGHRSYAEIVRENLVLRAKLKEKEAEIAALRAELRQAKKKPRAARAA